MPIELKLATDDTPEPWQAAEISEAQTDGSTAYPAPAYVAPSAPLDYAREGLPSAPPKSLGRTVLAILKRIVRAFGWLVGTVLLLAAFGLLVAATIVRLAFAAGAALLLAIRRASPFRLYAWLRYGGRVPEAQLA